MLLRRVSFVLFGLSLSIASTYLVNGQSCPSFPVAELGDSSMLSANGLVSLGLRPPSEENNPVNVRIIEYNFVCDASGTHRDTSSYVSVVVKFQCTTAIIDPSLDACAGESANITRQYQFSCIEDSGQPIWSATIENTRNNIQTIDPTATLTTPLDNRCRRCIDDRTVPASNATTHCEQCRANCTEGQRRCFFGPGFVEKCCNFYAPDGMCIESCPGNLVGGEGFKCVCPEITLLKGSVSYDPENRDIGSVATYSCEHGYAVVGNVTRTCQGGGWEGQDSSCELVVCDDLTIPNGNVEIEPFGRLLDSVATYRCDPGYGIKGDKTRICREDSNWSGSAPECADCSLALFSDCEECGFNEAMEPVCVLCKTGFVVVNGKCELEEATNDASTSQCDTICIVGIVLAIVGAIILSVVVALVVFGVYHFMSNPATKLAKAGTEGLNGVARDNPLYLPPEEIIGDVETA